MHGILVLTPGRVERKERINMIKEKAKAKMAKEKGKAKERPQDSSPGLEDSRGTAIRAGSGAVAASAAPACGSVLTTIRTTAAQSINTSTKKHSSLRKSTQITRG